MTTKHHLLLLWVLAWLLLFVAGSASALSGAVTLANELHLCDAVTHEYDAADTTCGYPQEGAIGHEGPYDAVMHLCGRVVEPSAEPGWPNVAKGTGLADDAFTHGYSYHPRIRARGLQDPKAHNFPYSFDDVILREAPVKQADGSLLYRKAGGLNGTEGVYEIAVNPETGTIFHRTFRGN